jgi:Ca2+-binding RTX toxin-like protein
MASPVAASASTVSLQDLGGTKGFMLHYDAAANETNNVTISMVGTCGTFTTCELVIEDTGAAITRPTSCTADAQSKVHCPANGVAGLDVKVLDGNDNVLINGSKPAVVDGGDGLDTLTGGEGGDSLDGGKHSDTLNGAAGDDTLADTGVSSSPDTLYGGAGDDTLAGGAWPDTLDGGTGADDFLETTDGDTADYSSRTTAVTVTLDGSANDGGPEDESGGRRDNVKALYVAGGSGDDMLTGDDRDPPNAVWQNVLTGNAGADNLDGRGGPDKLLGGAGEDTLEGGAGDDPSLDGGPGADDLLDSGGGATADYSGRATPVNVTLNGAANDGSAEDQGAAGRRDDVRTDDVSGSSGGDTLTGGTGDNALTGNDGPDTLAGGGGTDTLYAFGEPDQFGTVDPDADVDTLTGGEGGDTLHGDGDGETLAGEGDADTLRGHGGNDTLNGGEGGDDLDGGFGNDIHNGGPGADSMLNDRGADDFIGGDGIDSTSYADYYDSEGVTVTLDGNPNDGGEGFFNGQSPYNQDWPYTPALADRRGDNVQTENVTGSSRQGDDLTGDGDDNVLVGAGGQVGFAGDRVTGGGGDDIAVAAIGTTASPEVTETTASARVPGTMSWTVESAPRTSMAVPGWTS